MSKQLSEVNQRLGRMEEMQQQTLWLIKGSEQLEIEGVIPSLKRIDNDMQRLNKWKDDQENKNKWRKEARSNILKVIGWVAGTIGTLFGIVEAYRSVF